MSTIACTNIIGESFAECLQWHRLERGWSYADLAHLTGISTSTLRRWEKVADYVPTYANRYALRLAFGLSKTDDHGWWQP